MHIADQSTTKIFLKKHKKQSPDNTKVQFKLSQDIDESSLVLLGDFLNTEEGNQQGYKQGNTLDHLPTYAPLLVFNPCNTSNRIKILVDPARPSRAGATVRDNVLSRTPSYTKKFNHIINAQFSLSHALAVISVVY